MENTESNLPRQAGEGSGPHIYTRVFADGKVTATATVRVNPLVFRLEWCGPMSRRYWPEYVAWRQMIFDDVEPRTGHRTLIIDLI